MSVVTRFAPSPTGMLHIGGARTALFNWLFSRHHAGQFLLRVEDTDRARSTGEAVEAIFAGLKWLGLDWDQEPFFQSRNLARHQALGRRLLAEGKAYRCYITPDELAEMRQKARAEGRPVRYDRWRDRDPSEAPAGVAPAIRFRAPDQGETVIDDQVQGVVRFDVGQLDDMILLRGDGTPTYMLAVVADDHDMAVTHVIRGVDHLTNAARQAQLFMALGWEVPVFAHIPLIHGPDGAKLSKRHGALAAQAYRDQGFLPEAMRNYLARLGWSHGDDEIFSTDQMVEWFGLEAIGKSPARFDMDKLRSLNGTYIQQAKDSRLMKIMPVPPTAGTAPVFVKPIESLLPKLKKRAIEMESPPPTAGTAPVFVRVTEPVIPPSADKADVLVGRIELLMPELKQRAKTLIELSENATFLIAERPIQMIPKAAKLLKGDAPELLEKLLNQLKSLEKWTPEALEYSVKGFAESEGLKLGAVAQPLRAALTGSNASPGIFDVLAVLGREESLGRIADAARPA